MEDFWSMALQGLKIWLYLIVASIMVPAMFGFSLGISETYMSILVKTLEVIYFKLLPFIPDVCIEVLDWFSASGLGNTRGPKQTLQVCNSESVHLVLYCSKK